MLASTGWVKRNKDYKASVSSGQSQYTCNSTHHSAESIAAEGPQAAMDERRVATAVVRNHGRT